MSSTSMLEVEVEMDAIPSKNSPLGKWKLEPISPNGNSPSISDDDLYLDDIDDDYGSALINDGVDPELNDKNNSSRAHVATKLLEQLDEWIKHEEEPLTDWLEEKESLFDELPVQENNQNKQISFPFLNNEIKVLQPQSTQFLLQEFESVLGDVEACHQIFPSGSSTLTPPQSPPPSLSLHQQQQQLQSSINHISNVNNSLPIDINTHLMVTFQPYQSIDFNGLNYQSVPGISLTAPSPVSPPLSSPTSVTASTPSPTPIIQFENESDNATQPESYLGQISGEWNAENISLMPLIVGAANESKEVDEIDAYVRSCAKDITPCTSGPSSPNSSSIGSYIETSDDSVDDPEWTIPSTSNKKLSTKPTKQTTKTQKNRYKPYGRSVEDKKNRKKEQNKNAATRYRQKKKQEVNEILGEEQELVIHNEKLKDKVTDLKREIGYLKGLMREMFKAKGLIN